MENNAPYPVPLTKREQFTMAAMQGLCSSAFIHIDDATAEDVSKRSVEIADATMSALGIKEEIAEPVNISTVANIIAG